MPIMFADLSQLAVMAENGFVDAIVSTGLVGDAGEELRKIRPVCVAFGLT